MTFCAVFKWFKNSAKPDDRVAPGQQPAVVSSIKIKDIDIHGGAIFATFAVLYALYLWFIDIADLYVLDRGDGRAARQPRVEVEEIILDVEEDLADSEHVAALNLSRMSFEPQEEPILNDSTSSLDSPTIESELLR